MSLSPFVVRVWWRLVCLQLARHRLHIAFNNSAFSAVVDSISIFLHVCAIFVHSALVRPRCLLACHRSVVVLSARCYLWPNGVNTVPHRDRILCVSFLIRIIVSFCLISLGTLSALNQRVVRRFRFVFHTLSSRCRRRQRHTFLRVFGKHNFTLLHTLILSVVLFWLRCCDNIIPSSRLLCGCQHSSGHESHFSHS